MNRGGSGCRRYRRATAVMGEDLYRQANDVHRDGRMGAVRLDHGEAVQTPDGQAQHVLVQGLEVV